MQAKDVQDDTEIATAADLAKVRDDFNMHQGDNDKAIAELWAAIKRGGGTSSVDASDHQHVPPGHGAESAERATGAVAVPAAVEAEAEAPPA